MKETMLRLCLAEFIGTFALVFMGCGTRIMVGGDIQDFAGILMVHLVFGFTIATMVYTLGHISAAHLNPAITLGFSVTRRFPWRGVLPYWLAQFLGAILASTVHSFLFPLKAGIAHYGATTPKVSIGPAFTIEFILTFFLMLVSMATGTDRRVNRGAAGIAVGLTVILDGLFGNSLTGGSMNPARSLGPALFAGSYALQSIWLYFVAPMLAAVVAALIYEVLRGHSKSVKGAPEQLLPTDENIAQMPIPQAVRRSLS